MATRAWGWAKITKKVLTELARCRVHVCLIKYKFSRPWAIYVSVKQVPGEEPLYYFFLETIVVNHKTLDL